jgi:hypothetical protein
MEFAIACETIKRLNRIAGPEHRFIRLEHYQECSVAIVTNKKIAVIEKIGINPQNLNGAILFPLNDSIIAQCEQEAPFNSVVKIIANSVLGWATASTTLGFPFQGNAMIPGESVTMAHMNDWREWLPPKPVTKTNGAMFWTADWIAQIASAAPSGRIVFPEFIDVSKPVILRDFIDEKWLGIFMANRVTDAGVVENAEPATVPKWIK